MKLVTNGSAGSIPLKPTWAMVSCVLSLCAAGMLSLPTGSQAQPTSGGSTAYFCLPACVLQTHEQATSSCTSRIPHEYIWVLAHSAFFLGSAGVPGLTKVPQAKPTSGGGTPATKQTLCCRHVRVLLVAQHSVTLANPPVLTVCALAPGCKQPHRLRRAAAILVSTHDIGAVVVCCLS